MGRATVVVDEPLLDLDDIQGNIYPGFNKDHQTLRFLTIADVAQGRLALADLAKDVATSAMVRRYATLRAAIKAQRAGGPSGLTAIWMSFALGYSGLAKLAGSALADAIGGGVFKAGLAARSPLLGDPSDPGVPGHPASWSIGKPGSAPIDVVVTIAGDRREDVDGYGDEVDQRLSRYLAPDGGPALRRVHDHLKGDTLAGALAGHEHFGFKDGVSQPGIRGRVKSAPATFLTDRLIDPSSPLSLRYGRPGQILLWPGQILLGQPRQNGLDATKPLAALPVPIPWVNNGSFMVLRILQQDVPGFWAAMRLYARQILGRDDDSATDWVAARVVGRWRSGAPVTRTPDFDNALLTQDNRVVNDFGFRHGGIVPPLVEGQPSLPDLPVSRADPNGFICPFAAHIRKVNPRDDSVELGSPDDTLLHLLVRRGIPYGPAFADPRHAVGDAAESGLIFVSYQASIERQFEFLMQNWVNGGDAPHTNSGRDAVLGRHQPQGEFGATAINIADRSGVAHQLPQTSEFITARGGGYFFAPSISAIDALTQGMVVA
jgi:Dyp-type peroxidase family